MSGWIEHEHFLANCGIELLNQVPRRRPTFRIQGDIMLLQLHQHGLDKIGAERMTARRQQLRCGDPAQAFQDSRLQRPEKLQGICHAYCWELALIVPREIAPPGRTAAEFAHLRNSRLDTGF